MLKKTNVSIRKNNMPRLFVVQEGEWYLGTLVSNPNISLLLEAAVAETADDIGTACDEKHKAVAASVARGKYRVFVFPIQFADTAELLADYLRVAPTEVNDDLITLLNRAAERFD